MKDETTIRYELDLRIEELESMTSLDNNCGGDVSDNACDASLGGALSSAAVFSAIAVT